MKQAATLNDKELYEAIRDCQLDPDGFDHEAHIRLAWYYLAHWPYDQALQKFNHDFKRFVVNAGAAGKYHRTITDALLQLIASHLHDEKCRVDWDYFKQDAAPLFTDAYGLLQRYYSSGLLESETARKTFKKPDKAELPAPYNPA